MTRAVVAYLRVSSADHHLHHQREALALWPVGRCFEETEQGVSHERPELNKAIQYLREGDTLLVPYMDRLADTVAELENVVTRLSDKGVDVTFIEEDITVDGSSDSAVVRHVLSSIVGFEHVVVEECHHLGIPATLDGDPLSLPQNLCASRLAELRRVCRKRNWRESSR